MAGLLDYYGLTEEQAKLFSQDQLNKLAIASRARNLFDSLYDHPEHGLPFKQALKKVDPSLQIPDVDVAEKYAGPINAKIQEFEERDKKRDEEFQKWKQEREDEKGVGDLEKKIAGAKKRYRLTDEGMQAAIDRMKETGNPDPFAAAAWVASEIEPAKPVSSGDNQFGPTDANILGIKGDENADEDRKLLHNDPDRWFNKTVNSILGEFDESEAA